jgi:hypothetical protein
MADFNRYCSTLSSSEHTLVEPVRVHFEDTLSSILQQVCVLLPISWGRRGGAGLDFGHGLGLEVDLRLGGEKHVGKRLHDNIGDHADDGDKQDENPTHGPRCQYMIRRQDVTGKLVGAEQSDQLIDSDRPEVEQYREKGHADPRITQPAPASTFFVLLEGTPGKLAVDERFGLVQNLRTKRVCT